MHVFVTGGNGFIGSTVVKKLIEKEYTVSCLVRKTSNLSRLEGLDYQKIYGDVRDKASLENGLKECDAIVHLASLSNWNDIVSPLMQDVVVQGSQNLIEVALKLKKKRLVFVSSIAAVNGTKTPIIQDEKTAFALNPNKYVYAKAKLEVEDMCINAHKHGLETIIVNPGEVYGPNDTSLNTAANLIDFAKSSPVLVCRGGTSIVHVDDVAAGITAALTKGRSGERYILGGENVSVKELAQLTLKILEQKKKITELPNGLLTFAALIADKLKIPFPINPKIVPYATLFWFMDNQKAVDEFGISFRSAYETLLPTIKWLQKTKHI